MRVLVTLLFFLLICFSLNAKKIKLRDEKSKVQLSNNVILAIKNQINEFGGIFERELGSVLTGAGIVFDKGTLREGKKKFKLSALMQPDAVQEILLTGDKVFKGSGSRTFQDIKISGANNRIEGELICGNDIEFQDSNTTVTFAITRRLNKNINLNGGELFLEEDLYLINGANIIGPGSICLNERSLIFGARDLYCDTPIYFDNAAGFELNGDVYLSNIWTFSGQENVIIGKGHDIFIEDGGAIVVEKGSKLLLNNVVLQVMSGNELCCLDNSSTITFHHVSLLLDGDYTFSLGRFIVKHELNITGNYAFVYQSSMTSTILKNSVMNLENGMTFSYDPSNRRDLLCFENATSCLYLNDAKVHATKVGMHLKKGHAIVNCQGEFVAEEAYNDEGDYISGGIEFGDQLLSDDFPIEVTHGSVLEFSSGFFSYRNIDSDSWNMHSLLSVIKIQAGVSFEHQESLDIGNGRLFLSKQASFTKYPGKTLTGEVSITA